jgi:two-component system chemotaxis response regulator CheY
MRILVVEDDYASRRIMQKYLAVFGDVDVVVDGEEAVEAFKISWQESAPYTVIFLDIMLPKTDGQAALKKIRELEKGYGIKPANGVKVVMTTALGDPRNVVEACMTERPESYLVKPIERDIPYSGNGEDGFHSQTVTGRVKKWNM